MTVIHAYRRKEATTVDLFGISIEFRPNDKKDVVADVDHEEAVERLLSIREAYRLYAEQPPVAQVRVESTPQGAAAAGETAEASANAEANANLSEGEGGKATGTADETGPGVDQPQYVFTNEEGVSIDISKWTAVQIREFAEANAIELPKGNSVKVGELRDLLAAALRTGAQE